MGSGIATMINNNKLKIDQFFIMHPFAIHERKIYEDALSDVDFFGELFAETNKTFERLSTLCNIIDNHDKNLLVITGYRGCGKTNFVKFVQNLAEGKPVLIPMYEARNYEMHVCNDSEIQKGIKRAYEGSKEKIVNTFFEVKDEIEDILETQQFVEYIQRKVRSKVEYINFDEITLQSSRPIDEALYYRLRRKIYRELQEGDLSRIANTIDIFVTENAWTIEEGFEEIDYESFKQFWFKVRDYLHLISNKNDIGVLFDELKKLKLEQILFAFTVFDYAKMIVDENHGNNQKVIYILDNIDIISDDLSDVFQRSMMGIWKYLWDSRNVFYRIQEDNKSNAFSSIFENTKIIVVMRETTAMHITGHLRDKMRGIMDHFDMSPDINKNLIVQKRLKLAESLIETGKIKNNNFESVIGLLKYLTTNTALMSDLFALFNNDYRTAIGCLVTIIKENLEEVKKAKVLLDSNNSLVVNGGKGIIYRLLFEGFYNWHYFDGMGIPSRRSIEGQSLLKIHESKYSIARVLLTVLIKRQVIIPERFFVNPEESVRFSELYNMVSPIIDLDDMIILVDKLYSLSNKKYWNHLVTFDNIFQYSPERIKRYIEEKKKNPSIEDIYIRPTSAGQMFVELISPHYEFFACRFATNRPYSLFHYDNIDEESQVKSIKTIITDVYNMVKKCINNLESFNLDVMKIETGATRYSDIAGSPYYYQSQFHEERIIHTHITYLESYRQYIGEIKPEPKNYFDMNRFLLEKMEAYLKLLRYDPNEGIKDFRDLYISRNSKRLYNELSVCIEKIKSDHALSRIVSVTRDYYLNHYRDELCKEMETAGENDV